MSPTRRWSQDDCLSQIVLEHALRQATVWLSFDVRQKMKYFPFLALISLFGCSTGCASVGETEVAIRATIIGSVKSPSEYTFSREELTLSALLDRAGGIQPGGSQHIGVTIKNEEGEMLTYFVEATTFYAEDVDYTLPAGAVVFVSMCSGIVGESSFDYARLELERSEYHKRRAAGILKLKNIESKSRKD